MPSRPLVVLQVLPALNLGGVERGTIEIAEAVASAGGTALVASSGGRLAPAVERVGGQNLLLPLSSKQPWTMWRNAAQLAHIMRREAVDVVHARSRAPAWSAWIAARRVGAHFVTTYHAPYSEDFPGKRCYNAVMARGERVIAISQFVAGVILARHRVDPFRIRIIPRGVDSDKFNPTKVSFERVRHLAATWKLPAGHEVIVLPARLSRWKGQAVLIDAVARLQRQDVTAVLVGAEQGHGSYAQELAAQAERLGVAARVRIVGPGDDMPAVLALASIVVSPSQQPEGFGRVIVEAQSMARPVIATDHGGAAETVDEGVTGWRVPVGDPNGLALALTRVLAMSPIERAAVGTRARASVQQHYTVKAMQKATMSVYEELLADAASLLHHTSHSDR